MKKILCYGDSNTFGYNPVDASRFDEKSRWTAILQRLLGNEYEIIEEGACDRTGFVDNDKGFLFSSQKHFPKMFAKKDNIDILILAIGTNDLQFKYNLTLEQAEKGLENLVLIAKEHAKNIILVPPVILDENILSGFFNFQFDKTSIIKSKNIREIYKKISKVHGTDIFDFNEFVKPSEEDGLHYNLAGHKIIADHLAQYLLQNRY